jgi:translation initiation factor 1
MKLPLGVNRGKTFATMKSRDWKDPTPAASSPFAGLAGLQDKLGSLPAGPTAPTPKPVAKPKVAWAVVRLERKGRAGKEVTAVEKLGLSTREMARWCSDLKSALGCGGQVEGAVLIVQGDQRERVRDWLLARGVAKVTLG